MSSIPEEIYQEILLMVPVKSLIVCKCVCKKWYDLISTSDFVKLHLELTTQMNNPSLMVEGDGKLKSISYDSLATSVGEIEDAAIEIEFTFRSLNYGVQLAGSCNGLLCIRVNGDYDSVERLCLWNPATRECKEIPQSRFVCYSLCAFGCDQKTDDYKVVIGEPLPGGNTLLRVYTSASNSWKPVKTVPCGFYNFDQRYGVLANGDLHWLTRAQNKFSLHSLDFSDENFKELGLPPMAMNRNLRMVLGVLEGHLCILVDSFIDRIKIHLEVWEMLDYGVQGSWTRRYTITHQSIILNDIKSTSPVWCFVNGKILFKISGSLVLYDPKCGSAIKLNNRDYYPRHEVNYFESLVSLSSGTYAGRRGNR